VDRGFLLGLAAAAAARRLGIDPGDLVAGSGDLGERAGGKVGRSHEGEAERHCRSTFI
jgi:hypothetical protein